VGIALIGCCDIIVSTEAWKEPNFHKLRSEVTPSLYIHHHYGGIGNDTRWKRLEGKSGTHSTAFVSPWDRRGYDLTWRGGAAFHRRFRIISEEC